MIFYGWPDQLICHFLFLFTALRNHHNLWKEGGLKLHSPKSHADCIHKPSKLFYLSRYYYHILMTDLTLDRDICQYQIGLETNSLINIVEPDTDSNDDTNEPTLVSHSPCFYNGSPGLFKNYANFYKKPTHCHSSGNFLIFLVAWPCNTVIGIIIW